MVFGIHCNFFIVSPIRKIGRVLEVLRTRARAVGIGPAICPGLLKRCKELVGPSKLKIVCFLESV